MKRFYVYAYFRSVNGKHGLAGSMYYVGKGTGRRAWSRRHHVAPPKDVRFIKILANNLAENDALQAEMLLIRLHGRIDKNTGCLWNRSDGGEFTPSFRGMKSPMKGKSHSSAAIAKMSAAKLGRKNGPRPPEVIAKIAASNRGQKRAPEVGAKISQAKRGQEYVPRSAAHREAIRQHRLGCKRPDMAPGSPMQLKAAATRRGQKRGPYRKKETNGNDTRTI